ncbi:MAG TPA: MFS transporter [Bacteriovoracaceae bacterium]|nr:MFS transporter [Bacteriovoracaceae bacterium]
MDQKPLLLSDKYWPIFWTQFWGAMNDNVFKNAMVILITFRAYSMLGLSVDQMVAVCGGIFILPFFVFSSISGQLSDKISKSKLVVYTKMMEVVVMGLGTLGFLYESLSLLFISLFLMGLQSTIFGPVKYSILPELVEENDIVKGNAYVEMGTFLAILIGTITGGVLIGSENGGLYVSGSILFISLLGLACSFKIPSLAAVDPSVKIDINLVRSTWEVLKIGKQTKSIYISILGISWFWFFGATLLSIFPVYVKDTLHSNEAVVTLFLAIFSIGVAIGSVFCEKFSHQRVELGLVPFGSIGLSAFVLHLYSVSEPIALTGNLLNVSEFLSVPGTYWILFDLAGLSIMSGFFIVPLYTFIQMRSPREIRSRVIAANNIVNALFMVAAAVMLTVLFSLGLKVTDILLVLFVLNTLVSVYIYTVIPEFLWRFLCVLMGNMIYRLKVRGLEHIPHEGPAVLICNHVSFVDWLIISACVKRPVRFVMHYSFMKIPLLSIFLRGAKVIPIAGSKEDPDMMEKAFDKISETLKDDEIVCIFPEGKVTYDGELNSFRLGIEKIIQRNPVPVIPMALRGLWGSFFSRKYGGAASKLSVIPKRFLSRVELLIHPSWAAQEVEASKLQSKVKSMLDE